jgi:hypothetical protein
MSKTEIAYVDREGLIRYVKDMPVKPEFIDTMEAIENCLNDKAMDEYKQVLMKLPPFEDQGKIQLILRKLHTDGNLLWAPKPDTFYSFEGEVGIVEVPEFPGFDHTSYPTFKTVARLIDKKEESQEVCPKCLYEKYIPEWFCGHPFHLPDIKEEDNNKTLFDVWHLAGYSSFDDFKKELTEKYHITIVKK